MHLVTSLLLDLCRSRRLDMSQQRLRPGHLSRPRTKSPNSEVPKDDFYGAKRKAKTTGTTSWEL